MDKLFKNMDGFSKEAFYLGISAPTLSFVPVYRRDSP